MDGIHQIMGRDIWRADVTIVMNLTVPWIAEKVLIFCEVISYVLVPHHSVSEEYLVKDINLPHFIFPNE